MNPEDKEFVAMSAAMEGKEQIVRDIGKKVKVSEMELICLVNMAELGCLSVLSSLVEEDSKREAAHEYMTHIQRILDTFSTGDKDNGLIRLTTSAVALTRGRLMKYLIDGSEVQP